MDDEQKARSGIVPPGAQVPDGPFLVMVVSGLLLAEIITGIILLLAD